jgi:hypothetical protein
MGKRDSQRLSWPSHRPRIEALRIRFQGWYSTSIPSLVGSVTGWKLDVAIKAIGHKSRVCFLRVERCFLRLCGRPQDRGRAKKKKATPMRAETRKIKASGLTPLLRRMPVYLQAPELAAESLLATSSLVLPTAPANREVFFGNPEQAYYQYEIGFGELDEERLFDFGGVDLAGS